MVVFRDGCVAAWFQRHKLKDNRQLFTIFIHLGCLYYAYDVCLLQVQGNRWCKISLWKFSDNWCLKRSLVFNYVPATAWWQLICLRLLPWHLCQLLYMLIYVNDISDASFKYNASGMLCLFLVILLSLINTQHVLYIWKFVINWFHFLQAMPFKSKGLFLCLSLNSTVVGAVKSQYLPIPMFTIVIINNNSSNINNSNNNLLDFHMRSVQSGWYPITTVMDM